MRLKSPVPFRIVVSGGPCSGKTSVMKALPGKLAERGLQCMVVPESATYLLSTHAFLRRNPSEIAYFQRCVLQLQLLIEAQFLELANVTCPDIVLLDRGACDGAAFVDEECWAEIIAAEKLTPADLLARYDGVILLGPPPPGVYRCETNGVRRETEAAALAQSERLQRIWSRHPAYRYIPSYPTFEEKQAAAVDAVLKLHQQSSTL